MAMSDQLRLWIPGVAALLLLVLSSLPFTVAGLPLVPHVVWLMTLTVVALAPAAWPVTLAFFLGLLSDFLMDTPLGAQALLALLLTLFMQRRRSVHQLFQLRWAEACVLLVVLYFLLWVIVGWIAPQRPPILDAMLAAGINMLWYPLFYFLTLQLLKLLPGHA